MMKKNHAAKRSWRVLALALCLAMLVGLLPTVALAAVDETWADGKTISSTTTLSGGTESKPYTFTVTGTVTVNELIQVTGYASFVFILSSPLTSTFHVSIVHRSSFIDKYFPIFYLN